MPKPPAAVLDAPPVPPNPSAELVDIPPSGAMPEAGVVAGLPSPTAVEGAIPPSVVPVCASTAGAGKLDAGAIG